MSIEQTFALAVQRHRAGGLAEAEVLYRQVLTAQPNHAGALHLLGVIDLQSGRGAAAVERIRAALNLIPNDPIAHNNLGEAYRATGRMDEAVASYRRALALQPDLPQAHGNLGFALAAEGRLGAAVAEYRRALEVEANSPTTYNNLGKALKDQGKWEEAAVAYRRALELKPDYDLAKFNLAIILLLRGDFERGWPLYESRWAAFPGVERDFSQPRWDGSALHGRRVLMFTEQGLGDSIQFIRYAPLIAARGGEVIVECQESLVEVFRGVKGVGEVVAFGNTLPPFDLCTPMPSQPFVFQTTLGSIPQEVPYLHATAARREIWRERLGGDRSRFRVGLTWAGNTQKSRVTLDSLRPLFQIGGVDFISLQLDRGTQDIRQFSGGSAIIDRMEHVHDFADTAALMMELDLIISVDTSVAHLAGALGRPVWTLLQFVPDWRWGLEGESTPWYPSMRLFRQPGAGEWDAVIQQAARELISVRSEKAG